MLTSQRKTLIAQRLDRDGEIVAKTLAAELDLSEDTIRRDLREMAADGLLKRLHGGARDGRWRRTRSPRSARARRR